MKRSYFITQEFIDVSADAYMYMSDYLYLSIVLHGTQ